MLLRAFKPLQCLSALTQSWGTWRNSVLCGLVLLCCIGINLCSSYKLQLHLLRTSEVVPQLEVKVTPMAVLKGWKGQRPCPSSCSLGGLFGEFLVFSVQAGCPWEWQKLHLWLSGFSWIKPWLNWADAGLGTTLSKSLVGREEMSPTFLCLHCRTAAFYLCLINEQCLINAWHSVGFQQCLCCWETVLLCWDGFFFFNFHLLLSTQEVGQKRRRGVTLSRIYSGNLALDLIFCEPAEQQDLKHIFPLSFKFRELSLSWFFMLGIFPLLVLFLIPQVFVACPEMRSLSYDELSSFSFTDQTSQSCVMWENLGSHNKP